ncbi:penicillin-binding protein 1A [Thalassotalea insulae]|uniref:Penicillin-binding protein 1A n=1 Tax=Thalassotalea insulae TaxID=2056778 RepID=A0ABQ6GT47_9GAMM|nr:PBP1A family penicillin-binding protein [Thalassotalea insulae]GLX78824.1 penicillin-binding protein 1A [Thalassotalea insulae]
MFSFKKILKIGVVIVLLGIFALFALYLSMRSELPSVESLKDIQWQTPMKIYSADGQLMNQFGEKKRIPLSLEQMPQQLINAILATEDERFYLHFGVDPIGMMRAIFGQITGQNKGGASTITMQVARNFFLTREQTYIRKLKEIFTAFHIEHLLTKDEILELYMNKIELGHRAFGFGAAAQVYYNKDVKDLTLAQMAVLAGLPKAPSTMNPISRPERAKARRAVVLQRMLVTNYITRQQYQQAVNAPITAQKHGAVIELDAPYAAEMAHQEMIERYGTEKAYTEGYKVFTTVTAKLQKAAQHSVINNLLAYSKRHGYRGPQQSLRTPQAADDQQVSVKELAPLSQQEIIDALSQVIEYKPLLAAVVTQVNEQSIEITLKNNTIASIPWSGLSWAREFINDDKQGPEPQVAKEILNYGDVIYVTQQQDGYHLSQLPSASSALVALSPDNGAIKAVVGGFSFEQSQFNRVTQAKRQVGSNIKPFVYSAALDNGFTLASLVNDVPINQWDQKSGFVWRPKNSPEQYSGEIRVKRALAQSKNVVAVRLLRAVGLNKLIPHLASFGFAPDELPRDESLALGSASFTPLEVAAGFATFANGGFLIEPFIIERIEDSFGNIVYQANPAIACDDCTEFLPTEELTASLNNQDEDFSSINETNQENNKPAFIKAERAISASNAFLITQALNEVIWGADWSQKPGWQGTGFRARKLNRRDIAGKTGTTNEAKDAWFSGFSRRLVATSWIGFDDPSRNLGRSSYNNNLSKDQITGKEFGAKSAQPAWISFMRTALEDLAEEPFIQPSEIVSVRIDKKTGKLTRKTDRSSTFEYFILGTAPTEYISKDHTLEIFDTNEQTEEIF